MYLTSTLLPIFLLFLESATSTSPSLDAALRSPAFAGSSPIHRRQIDLDNLDSATAKTPGFDYASPAALHAASPSCAKGCITTWFSGVGYAHCTKKDTILTDFFCLCDPTPPGDYQGVVDAGKEFGDCVNKKCTATEAMEVLATIFEATLDCLTYPKLASGVVPEKTEAGSGGSKNGGGGKETEPASGGSKNGGGEKETEAASGGLKNGGGEKETEAASGGSKNGVGIESKENMAAGSSGGLGLLGLVGASTLAALGLGEALF